MSEPKSIFIIGGSAGAKIATDIFNQTHPHHILYYVECFCEDIVLNRLYSTIDKALDHLLLPNIDYFIATGDNKMRKEHYELIKNYTKKEPINCIHPSAVISGKRLGNGNLVCPNAVIHIDAVVGDCTIINTGSVIEHDCHVDDFSQISPNATLCGYVKIGKNCFISAGSTIIPKITIGDNSVVAAGSVVIEDVPPDVMVAGAPSKIKKHYKNEKS
jgi:sugar O-acyltransferase (sialic acid O-acetyltransferase NeuD family)